MPALGDLAFHHVGSEGGKRRTTARQDAKQAAHRSATQHGWDGPPYFFARHHQAADLAGHDGARFGLFQVQDDFSDTKHAHGDGHKANAIGKFRNAKGEALLAGLHIRTHQAERHAEHHHADGLYHRPLRQHGRDNQAKQHEREVIRRPKGQRNRGEQRPGSRDQHGGNAARKEGCQGRNCQRGASTPAPGHLIAFKRCDDRTDLPR